MPDTIDAQVFMHKNANQLGVDPAMRLLGTTATNIAVKVEQPSPVVTDQSVVTDDDLPDLRMDSWLLRDYLSQTFL